MKYKNINKKIIIVYVVSVSLILIILFFINNYYQTNSYRYKSQDVIIEHSDTKLDTDTTEIKIIDELDTTETITVDKNNKIIPKKFEDELNISDKNTEASNWFEESQKALDELEKVIDEL